MKKDLSIYVWLKFSLCVLNYCCIFIFWIWFFVFGVVKCCWDGVCFGYVDGKWWEDWGWGFGGVVGDGGDKVSDVKVGFEGIKFEDCVVGVDGDVVVYFGVFLIWVKLYLC